MIPKNITKEDILTTMKLIDEAGVPKVRISRLYLVQYEGKDYPPKYVISLANKLANGNELLSTEFSGGLETNNFLEELGFEIVLK